MATDTNNDKTELRDELIREAGKRLSEGDTEEFSTVELANSCNTSRQMIYTLFGGKSGLLKAVYLSKSEELSDKLAEITTSDPIDRLFELGTIYRQFMLDHKALFDAVFSLRTVRNFKGSGALIDRTPAFDYFQKAIEDLIDEGYLAEQTDPKTLTDRLWAGVIGVLLLETLGFYSDSESAREAFFDVAISIVFGKLKDDDLQDAFAQGLDIV